MNNNLSSLLGITAVGTSIVKAKLIQHFVRDLAGVITLAITTGFVVGALLVGVFYVAYEGLLYYGLESMPAQLLIAAAATLTVAVLIGKTTARLKSLTVIPGQIIHTEFPLASRLNTLADSFMAGLLDPQHAEK